MCNGNPALEEGGGGDKRKDKWMEGDRGKVGRKKEKECGCDAWINEQKLGCRRA